MIKAVIFWSFLAVLGTMHAQNGTLDLAFGDSGQAVLQANIGSASAFDIAVLPSNKIIVSGLAQGPFFEFYPVLARLEANGELDSSFGVNGMIDSYQMFSAAIQKVAVQSDGKIVAAGFLGTYNFAVFRFLADGDLDSTFSGDGIFTFVPSWTVGDGYANDLAVQPNGKILICGALYNDSAAVVVRLNQDGELDSTFGDNGIKKLEYLSYNTNANSLCLQPNGQILICGSVVQNAINHMCLFKLSALGEFDGTFGNKGIVQSAHNVTDVGVKVLVQNDEKIIAIGTAQANGAYRAVIQRWRPDGTADVYYSNGGQRTLQFSNLNQAVATDAVLMPDQNVLISARYPFSSAGAITRVMSNGQIDYSFGLNGTISNINTESYTALTMADSNQFLVVGSDFFVNVGEEPIVQKYSVVNGIGLEEINMKEWSVYPNPSQGPIFISNATPSCYRLYSSKGERVWQGFISKQNTTINMGNLPNGLYFLQDDFGRIERIVLNH